LKKSKIFLKRNVERCREVMNREIDEQFMRMALVQARLAWEKGEVPVGAVLIRGGEVLSAAHNRLITDNDPSAHAEMLAIRQAAERLENYRLTETTLYVTLEPCIMCAGVMIHARIDRLVYGARDPKSGGVDSLYKLLQDERLNHRVDVTGGILEEICAEILSGFFREKRITSRPISG
jgi:tRNA(adenine34) deaminase